MRFKLPFLGMLALAACDPGVPDSAAHLGADTYGRHMDLHAQGVVPGPQVNTIARQAEGPMSAIPDLQATYADDPARDVATDALAAIGRAPETGPAAQGGAQGWTSEPGMIAAATPVAPGAGGGITREEPFDPVRARAEARAEAERFEQRRAAFRMVEAEPLPDRPADATNIVAFALSTSHRVGEQRFRRSPLTLQNHQRNCLQFASDNLAQEEFLRRGGPDRDPLNLDPDGDGFACGWNPQPFRDAARVAAQGGG